MISIRDSYAMPYSSCFCDVSVDTCPTAHASVVPPSESPPFLPFSLLSTFCATLLNSDLVTRVAKSGKFQLLRSGMDNGVGMDVEDRNERGRRN